MPRERPKRACQGSGASGHVKGAAQAGMSRERPKRACQGSGPSGPVKRATQAHWARTEAASVGTAVGLLDVHWHSSWASTPHFWMFRGGRIRQGYPLPRPGLIGASVTRVANQRDACHILSASAIQRYVSDTSDLGGGAAPGSLRGGFRAAAARRLCRARRSAAMRAGARGAAKADFAGLSRP